MKFILFILFGFIFSNTFSQTIDSANVRPGENVEYCISHKKMQEMLNDPEIRKQYELEQEQFRQFQKSYKKRSTRGVVYTIPVVFHILHSGGIENISDDQILNALSILNRDYRLQNADAKNVYADFQGMPTDVEIEFKLATVAPDGTCFKGITRTYSTDTTTNGGQQVSIIKSGNDIYKGEWTGNQYLHVFVCKSIGGAAGYTYRPFGSGKSMTNGIWILHNYVGSIGTSSEIKSRALTHEVGHWLGLMHTWGPNNSPGNMASCDDPNQDEIDDTPATVGVTWCNLDEKSCGPRANVENYMDYSYCSKMFTPDQVSRMRATIISDIGGRSNVATDANLIAVGVKTPSLCKVDFQQSGTSVCYGSQVTFTDQSFNNVTQRKWLFPGGTPSESSDINPVVIYNTPGKYSVSLTVSDGNNELTKTVQNAVNVYSYPNQVSFLENFKGITDINNSSVWTVSNVDNNQAFKIYKGAGYSDSACIYINNFKDKTKSVDELISSAFDLSKVMDQSKITLSFRYAYRKINKTDNEYLKVYFSSDCGNTWNVKRVISGNALDTNISASNWIPSKRSDWKTIHMTNVSSNFWNPNMRIKFEFDGNGGNNLFLDDINLYPSGPSDSLILSTNNTLNYDYSIDSADFLTNQSITCLGSDTKFYDKSSSKVTNWKWSFPGAYPTTSIEENPQVLYTKTGVYNVSLTVGNGTNSKTITKSTYINVDDRKLSSPIIETFDTIKAFGRTNFWSQLNGNNEVKIDKDNNGNSFAFIQRGNTSNNLLSFQSKQLEFLQLKDTASITISFDVSLKGKNQVLSDSLAVYLSNNCGLTWTKIKTLPGSQFIDSLMNIDTNKVVKWSPVKISNFNKQLLKQFTLIRFDFTGKGNWLIDNISINAKSSLSINDLISNKFNIYPNPTDKIINLDWSENVVEKIEVIDVVGKVHQRIQMQPNFDHVEINCDNLQAGSYFIYITTQNGIVSKPFIVNSKN